MAKKSIIVVKERGRWLTRTNGKSRAATPEEVAMANELRSLRNRTDELRIRRDVFEHAIACRRHFIESMRHHALLVKRTQNILNFLAKQSALGRLPSSESNILSSLASRFKKVLYRAAEAVCDCREQTGVTSRWEIERYTDESNDED